MIVFQSCPCRLFPKICDLIEEQFEGSIYLNEGYVLKDDKDFESPNNFLEITPKNFQFESSCFNYGIFPKSKLIKKPGDFWFTIRFDAKNNDRNKSILVEEFYASLRYFHSYLDYKKSRYREEFILDEFCGNHSYLNSLSKEKLINLIKNPEKFCDLSFKYKDKRYLSSVEYCTRKGVFTQENHFDYVGDFSDWSRTIEEIKEKTNLDLSSLEKERPFAYIKDIKNK